MTFSVNFTNIGTADAPLLSIMLELANGGTVVAALTGGVGITPTPTPTSTPAVNYFPAVAANAPFPSPENSTQLVMVGVVTGAPYLRDKSGVVHTLAVVNGAVAYLVNGAVVNLSGSSSTPPSELIVRQGAVYIILSGSNIVQQLSANGSVYNTALPPAYAPGTTTASSPGLPPVPVAPTPSSIAPGSTGTIVCGHGATLATISAGISAAVAGNTVIVNPGTYAETPPAWLVPLHLIGTGVTINATGLTATLARGKAVLVPCADSIIDGFAITGAALDQTSAQLTSAIRPDAGCGYLTTNNLHLFGNQNGVGQGGFPFVWVDNWSTLEANGLPAGNAGNGYVHNIYVQGNKTTLNNTVSINPLGGHAFKSRAAEVYINGGTFNASDATAIDMPDGTTKPFTITNATINKAATDANHGVLDYAAESSNNGVAGGIINGGTINALVQNPFILTTGGTIAVSGVAINGGKISVTGAGIVTGL